MNRELRSGCGCQLCGTRFGSFTDTSTIRKLRTQNLAPAATVVPKPRRRKPNFN